MSKVKEKYGPGPVPSRWLPCPRKASDLIINKFLAFKTPLDDKFNAQVPTECRFPPSMLFDTCKGLKITLGLWIDLTNTKRFYNSKEVKDNNCKYVKLSCRGHGETPNPENTKVFVELVHKFIAQHPLECIGVHCTHGFNRTGFLIISYLVEKMDIGLEVALEMFAKVRPPGIYKKDYIEELCRRYGDEEDVPPPPPLPAWCFEEEEQEQEQTNVVSTISHDSAESSNSNDSNKKIKNSSKFRSQVGFMEGVSDVEVYLELPRLTELQRKVQRMCRWKGNDFPGCQPVSMSMDNLKFLSQKPYRVSWKADGTRYMMLIDGPNQIYFFDRDNNVFKVASLTFPSRGNLKSHLRNTLLDGEMVIDKYNGQNIPRYLVYDILIFEGQDVSQLSFCPDRLNIIQTEIINPRIKAMEERLIIREKEPFSVRKKDFWPIRQAANLLGDKFAKSLSHEPDGLIFQPAKEKYVPGRCDEVLKWKPLNMNSVDFRLKISQENGMGIIQKKVGHLYVGQLNIPAATMKYTKQLKDLNGKIIECNFENNEWKFMRERTDKSFPNSHKTAMAVFDSIKNPVTKEILLNFIKTKAFDDDSEMMPPPPKKVAR